MNKLLFTLASAAIGVASMSAQSGPYTLEGTFSGLPDGTKITLFEVAHEQMAPFAETTVENGHIILEGTLDEPVAVWMAVDGNYPGAEPRFILEPSALSISGYFAPTEYDGKTRYNANSINVSGSPLSDRYRAHLAVRDTFDEIYNMIHARYAEVNMAYGKARGERNEQEMKRIEETDEYKQMNQAMQDFFNDVARDLTAEMLTEKDNWMGPLLMISLTQYFTEDNRKEFEQMSDEAKNSRYGRRVEDELYPAGKAGMQMPDITLTDAEGNQVNLYRLCTDNNYVLVDFWASWCRPCRAEIPNLKKIYADSEGKGFQILSISIDENEDAWRKALESTAMPWTQTRDTDKEASRLYKVRSIPTMFIADSQGRLVAENLRGEELAAKIAELLAE